MSLAFFMLFVKNLVVINYSASFFLLMKIAAPPPITRIPPRTYMIVVPTPPVEGRTAPGILTISVFTIPVSTFPSTAVAASLSLTVRPVKASSAFFVSSQS